jgi:hypothetical protein
VAVGVDCAAATEHNHKGSHEPAAKHLHVDHKLKTIDGIELTTTRFGHFNVFPWASSLPVPHQHLDRAVDLFKYMKSLASEHHHVFQLNHPRLLSGIYAIGYLDLANVHPITGRASGAVPYFADYDAIELYNGYDLARPEKVKTLIKEWLFMLQRGELHTATASSDSHSLSYPWAGFPRTYVYVGPTWYERKRPVDDVVSAVKNGQAFVSSGPMIFLSVKNKEKEAFLGDSIVSDQAVATIDVWKSSWLAEPKLSVFIGVYTVPNIVLKKTENPLHYQAVIKLGRVDEKQSLVAFVEADMLEKSHSYTGLKTALALTNAIWLLPK